MWVVTALVRREPDPQDGRAVRVALTTGGAELAKEFYAETCRRIENLPAGLACVDRDRLADLFGQVVRDNKVPAVFMESDER
jgi:DNA-binding MarR family transcriptional regulator